ncbi:hypothetical protein NIES4074_48930 [Cylindrospermum sp. NIES-4074]|nr:hypothetical protein NIES4074_48930 [Cylindrospermum sp. NIES-4074]
MKSSPQPMKLFFALAFSCTSLLGSLTPVLAKPALPASGHSLSKPLSNKTAVAQTTRFNAPPPPPGPPPGGRVLGGASRGNKQTVCPDIKPALTTLSPFTEKIDSVTTVKLTNVWGLTTLEHPTWLFYMPYTKDSGYSTEFELQNLKRKTIYQKEITLPQQSGLIRVSLPNDAPRLAVGEQYRWYLKVSCDQKQQSPPTYVEGVIQRVNLNQADTQKLQTATPLQKFAIYAQNGIWYEALATLAEIRQKNPQNVAIQTEWQNFLANFPQFNTVAAAPIVSGKP